MDLCIGILDTEVGKLKYNLDQCLRQFVNIDQHSCTK